MAKSLSASALTGELATKTGLSKADVKRLLADLAEIAYREAANGFTLPGLCKFKLVHRAESVRYNPSQRRRQRIAAHDTLKVVPLKKARERMAPPPPNLILQDHVPPPPAAPSTPTSSAPTSDVAVAAPKIHTAPDIFDPPGEGGSILFACPHCDRTIMADCASRGHVAQCPECHGRMLVPDESLPLDEEPDAAGQPGSMPEGASGFVTFVCRDCGQEIEAPLEMIGMDTACPTCRAPLKVPIHEAEEGGTSQTAQQSDTFNTPDHGSMTIRMDLSDF